MIYLSLVKLENKINDNKNRSENVIFVFAS